MEPNETEIDRSGPCKYCGKEIRGRHKRWAVKRESGEQLAPFHWGCGWKYLVENKDN